MNSKLMKYGLSISVVCLGGCIMIDKSLQKRFRSEDYYQNAVIMLQKYDAGAEILGRPIFGGKVNLGNKDELFVSPLSATLSIPLKGSKQNGILHVLASRYDADEKWDIDQLDLELKSSGQRWMFYDRHRRGIGTDDTQTQTTSETSGSNSTQDEG